MENTKSFNRKTKKEFVFLIISLSVGLFFLGCLKRNEQFLIILYVKNISDSSLIVLCKYDNSVKNKLGLVYNPQVKKGVKTKQYTLEN